MKKTLLQITQSVMREMGSDDVNSIDDTQEAWDVANIIQDVYFDIVSNKDWTHLRLLGKLENSNDSTKPSYMKLPENVSRLDWINYNSMKSGETKARYKKIYYVYPDEFALKTNGRNSDAVNVEIVQDYSGVELLITNDKAPTYWTSFDDEYIVFDSYDQAVSTTLTEGNTQCQMFKIPTFSLEDDYVPDLPMEHFPLLIAESKSVAANAIQQMPNQKAEQQSTRHRKTLSQRGWKAKGGIRYPNYGRLGRKMYSANNNPLLEK